MMKKTIPIIIAALLLTVTAFAQEAKTIQLPKPDMSGGKPLMQALKDRKSSREFSGKPLPIQVLSDLLWAAAGVNRPESKQRTSPTAHNCQEIDIYVAMESGLYLYDAFKNILEPVIAKDIRAVTGKQDFVAKAPVNLIYVADSLRAKDFGDQFEFYSAADTGYISENVYLYCASAGLATVVRGWFDEKVLGAEMNLKPTQKIILTQTVGYP